MHNGRCTTLPRSIFRLCFDCLLFALPHGIFALALSGRGAAHRVPEPRRSPRAVAVPCTSPRLRRRRRHARAYNSATDLYRDVDEHEAVVCEVQDPDAASSKGRQAAVGDIGYPVEGGRGWPKSATSKPKSVNGIGPKRVSWLHPGYDHLYMVTETFDVRRSIGR